MCFVGRFARARIHEVGETQVEMELEVSVEGLVWIDRPKRVCGIHTAKHKT